MADEPHAVVRLLVKRMESHPEEFSNDDGRWAQWLDELMPFVTEKERMMLRKPMMQTIHEDVMDELLNGPERRRKQEEEREYERQVMQQAVQRNTYAQQNTYASQLGSYQNAMGIGTQSPSQPLVIGTGTEAMRIQANGDIQLGNQTLNEGLLKNIKKALKL